MLCRPVGAQDGEHAQRQALIPSQWKASTILKGFAMLVVTDARIGNKSLHAMSHFTQWLVAATSEV